MRLLVISLSASFLFLASCSEPTREALSSRGEEDSKSLNQPDLRTAVNSAGADDQHKVAQVHEESSHQEVSDDAHTDHTKHAHAEGHSSNKHQHGSHLHAHQSTTDEAKKIGIGEKVPDFEVTIAGKKWKLSELQKNAEMTKDGTLVLTFWCSFCHSCRHVEHPLDELAKEYKSRVAVIALDASAGETTETVAKFAAKNGLTLPIALNANGTAADIFGVHATTTTVVIDGHGLLRYRGQFMENKQAFAKDALQAVLAGNDVPQKETAQKG